ncbi:MAG: invasion associated locus B family protein [Pseudomonadota bacterium]
MFRKFLTPLIACAGLLAFASAADAQTAKPRVGEKLGAWTFQCQAVSADQNICALVQGVLNKKTNKQVLRAVVRPVGQGKDRKVGLFVTLPLGIFLAPGVAGKVDDGKQFPFILQACRQAGCEVAVELDAKLQKSMRAGKQLVVGFKTTPDSNAVGIPISLSGFTAGMKALN